jgi:amino acid transporter
LPEPWQQGLVILVLIAVTGIASMQRLRTTQIILNAAMCLALLAVALVSGAAIFWLLKGHPAQSSFAHASDWSINPSNFFFFGIITLNFIGASGPLTLAGEFKGAASNESVRRSVITHHLLIGSCAVFLLYFLVSLAVLIVRGPTNMNNAAVLPFEAFTAIDTTLGKTISDIAICCFLFYCICASIFYSMASSRILMVAAIDRRIPVWFGRLNKARVPGNALLFQMLFACAVVVVLFIAAPYLIKIGNNAATTLTIFYNVISSSLTLVWTLATSFFFINLVFVYRRNPHWFHRFKVLSMPLLWLCTFIGGLACLLTIVGILAYSWIPTLVSNSQWWPYVGGLALATILITGVGSLFANSQASWEALEQGASDEASSAMY